MSYSQEGRLISIDTPLGTDVLLLQSISGHEGISRLFEFELDLISENNSISFTDIVGKNVTISLEQYDGSIRYLNGCVSRFAQSGQDSRFTHYSAEVVPWLWFLTRNADCKIFQQKTVPEIITGIFDALSLKDYQNKLQGTYSPLDYCVQYRETHFNFISRLMEQFGIFYFFEHQQGKHTLILGDSNSVFPVFGNAKCQLTGGGVDEEDMIRSWNLQQELRTGKYTLTDYNFTTPSTSLLASEPTVDTVGPNSSYEIYDYPGDYLTVGDGDSFSKLRMQEEESSHLVVSGAGDVRGFGSGMQFTLQGHYRSDQNATYVLTEILHTASVGNSYYGGDTETHYSNHFTCIPLAVPFRAPRITPKPMIQGLQPAVVVGKSGEEIWVDQYGRVKVQFFWDRVGEKDENSSCWVRVSQAWAGQGWGAMWIPRIGQEVIVEFLEGDPDRPLITGRVYNAALMPPYALPDNGTRSTFMSRSSKGGGTANYNELRFEDKMGSEQIFMNAEKDMDWRVEHDSREFVGNNRSLMVTTDQLEQIGGKKNLHVKGDHIEKIEGAMSLQVVGDQKEKVGGNLSLNLTGDQKEQIGGAMSLAISSDQKIQVGGGYSLQVSQSHNEKAGQNIAAEAGQTIHLKGGMSVVIEAGMEVALKGPGGFVSVGPSGVTIQGTMVLINSGGAAGSGPGAQTQSPASPDSPADPTDPDEADDGSKGGKLNS
ncbi:MAG TPA: type VI secretion system tip protein TssI/VgrG [Terriglobia bacterium]|nr:type VI secretion system tip protein TssI/VgrG [Terriglobia bacterium]